MSAKKRVNEVYLIIASSCTEAEELIINELAQGLSLGGLEIKSLRELKISYFQPGVSREEPAKYYQARISSEVESPEGGKPRKQVYTALIQTHSVLDAAQAFQSLESYGNEVLSIKETPVIDIITADGSIPL